MSWVIIEKQWPLSCWDVLPTREMAEQRLAETSLTREDQFEILSWDDFVERRRNIVLTPIEEISERSWWNALECLPPLDRHSKPNGLELFIMSEFYTSSFSRQYARLGDRYFRKMVDTEDPSTYISLEEINELDQSVLRCVTPEGCTEDTPDHND